MIRKKMTSAAGDWTSPPYMEDSLYRCNSLLAQPTPDTEGSHSLKSVLCVWALSELVRVNTCPDGMAHSFPYCNGHFLS